MQTPISRSSPSVPPLPASPNGQSASIGSGDATQMSTRREWLERGLIAGAAVGLAGLASRSWDAARQQMTDATGAASAAFAPLPPDTPALRSARFALNRIAWSARPGELQDAAQIGARAWIETQLAAQQDENPTVTWRVGGLDVQQEQKDAPDALYSMADEQLMNETQQAAILRAVYSRNQLQENLADFWTNHFNIYALKNDGRTLIPNDTEAVIRPHALGSFREMLMASAHSPAMLAYLDNEQNQRGVPNENYARELLELHTLGVHSGYTQRDIQEVARCFTGWTVTTGFVRGNYAYEATRHDNAAKFIPFLNLTLAPNGGKRDAQTVLETLAQHPATARFVASKLCRRFLGVAPPEIVEKAANAYLKSQSDIRATLRPILLDALLSPNLSQPMLKRPLDYAVSALRVLGVDTDGGAALQKHLADMGQPLYQWPMPDGFPDKREAWTGSLLPRWNFALALAGNDVNGTRCDLNALARAAKDKTDDALCDTIIETVLLRPAHEQALQSLRSALTQHLTASQSARLSRPQQIAELTGLTLASPAFQWK